MKIENEKFIATAEFSKYLTSNGWVISIKKDGLFAIWESCEHPDYEILQPLNSKSSDFNCRVIDLVDVLSKTKNKSISDINSEINEISDDVIRIRVIHNDVDNGSIPFNDGVELFVKAKELLVSAARSVFKVQKGFYSGKSPEIVTNYFDSLKLSQTEIGSYILKVASPIYQQDEDQSDHCEVPFGRVVSSRIIHSVLKLEKAVESFKETNNHIHFEQAIGDGVGAALCSAIVGLSGQRRNRTVEISIQPSPYASDENLKSRVVTVPSNDIPIIEHARDYYLDNYSAMNYELSGKVTKLDRDKDVDHDNGVVTITETISLSKSKAKSKTRKVKVILNDKMYDEAIKAHEKSEVMRFIGTLIVSGRKVTLSNIQEVTVNSKIL
ncbi:MULTISPECIES: hypothetical protein [unclassified Providencia]|uniref:hypothetical protein n=1 Tax=unclassified Providencia TaxID=2633465 RepID=UPI0012B64D64|nr:MULTISPECIES: hypothetical protein [unclassified Providencia]MTC21809.1 hypothetical protein [Providencia sp. wls1938]